MVGLWLITYHSATYHSLICPSPSIIHITAELFGMSFIIRYDAFAMLGAVFLDMCYGFADRLDGFDRHFVIQKFRSKIFFRSFFQ